MDDRTEEERGLKVMFSPFEVVGDQEGYMLVLTEQSTQPLKESRFRIPKSRYGSVSLYISDEWLNRPEYNDIEAPYDPEILERLKTHGEDLISIISVSV